MGGDTAAGVFAAAYVLFFLGRLAYVMLRARTPQSESEPDAHAHPRQTSLTFCPECHAALYATYPGLRHLIAVVGEHPQPKPLDPPR